MALKQGIFTNLTLSQFLLTIMVLGFAVYFAAAIVFTKKKKDSAYESKGMILKRSLWFYIFVQAGYLGIVFMLLMTFQLDSYWGSRILIIILAANILLPFIILSIVSQGGAGKMISAPDKNDGFILTKGKASVTLYEAQQKQEFWFTIVSAMIIMGVARMMDENSSFIALHNADGSQRSKRVFQILEVCGSFVTGVFLSLFRIYVSPYALLMVNAFLLVASQVLMFFISVFGLAQFVATIIVGFNSGSTLVCLAAIAHESYGKKYLNVVLGYMLTGVAVGFFLFDVLIFDQLYGFFATEADVKYQKSYGKWNKYIFLVSLLASIIALLMSIGGYLKTRKSDKNEDAFREFYDR